MISRQRKWQIKQIKQGNCQTCGKKAITIEYCLKHTIAARERDRKYKGSKRRNLNSASYKLEERNREGV